MGKQYFSKKVFDALVAAEKRTGLTGTINIDLDGKRSTQRMESTFYSLSSILREELDISDDQLGPLMDQTISLSNRTAALRALFNILFLELVISEPDEAKRIAKIVLDLNREDEGFISPLSEVRSSVQFEFSN